MIYVVRRTFPSCTLDGTPGHAQTGALVPVLEQFVLAFPPTGVFLGSGRKPEKPDEAHIDTGNMCIETRKQ